MPIQYLSRILEQCPQLEYLQLLLIVNYWQMDISPSSLPVRDIILNNLRIVELTSSDRSVVKLRMNHLTLPCVNDLQIGYSARNSFGMDLAREIHSLVTRNNSGLGSSDVIRFCISQKKTALHNSGV